MKFQHLYDDSRKPVFSDAKGETMTQQQHKDDCDINNILKRYEKTGILPDLIKADPQYGDFSTVPSYQQALDTVYKAQEQFDALGAKIRERFQNDPEKFLQFVNDPKNIDEMCSLGLATKVQPVKIEKEVQPEIKGDKQ